MQATAPEATVEDIDTEAKSEVRKMVEKFVDENPEAAANQGSSSSSSFFFLGPILRRITNARSPRISRISTILAISVPVMLNRL